MDWNPIKTEYIAGGTSYRKLAEKYNVSFSKLKRIAIKERWADLREQARAEADTKMVEAVSDKQAERMRRLQDVTDDLLGQIEGIVKNFSMADLVMDKQSLRQITGALKDIKDIQSLKSPLDIEEQQARIAKLRREADGNLNGVDEKPCGIILLPRVNEGLVPPAEVDADE